MNKETAAKLAAVRERHADHKDILHTSAGIALRTPAAAIAFVRDIDTLLNAIDELTAERDAAAAKDRAEIVAMLRTESRQWTEDAEGKANRGDFHNAVGSNHRAAALSDMADELENDAIEADAAKGEG